MHPDWARSLRDQCAAAGVPFLFKQWGEWIDGTDAPLDWTGRSCLMREPNKLFLARVGKKRAGRLLDGVQHDGYPGEAPAKATEARRAETGIGSVHDGAVPQAFAQNIPGDYA